MNTWTFSTFFVLGILIIIAIYTFVSSWLVRRSLANNIITRGANGVQGQTLNLTCPAGQQIRINTSSLPGGMTRSRYVCSNPTPLGGDGTLTEDPECDPYFQSTGQLTSNFNPATTLDATKDLYNECNGKNQCTFTIPSPTTLPNICGGKVCTGHIQLIANYDCVPQS